MVEWFAAEQGCIAPHTTMGFQKPRPQQVRVFLDWYVAAIQITHIDEIGNIAVVQKTDRPPLVQNAPGLHANLYHRGGGADPFIPVDPDRFRKTIEMCRMVGMLVQEPRQTRMLQPHVVIYETQNDL